MKVEFEDIDIQRIANMVVDAIRPLIASSSISETNNAIMTKKQLAEYLRVSESTVNSLLAEGSLPYFKITQGQSGGVRFRKRDVDAWIAKQTIPPVNPARLAKF